MFAEITNCRGCQKSITNVLLWHTKIIQRFKDGRDDSRGTGGYLLHHPSDLDFGLSPTSESQTG